MPLAELAQSGLAGCVHCRRLLAVEGSALAVPRNCGINLAASAKDIEAKCSLPELSTFYFYPK
jgi:hypothetical protein